jgi:hypothetical protein
MVQVKQLASDYGAQVNEPPYKLRSLPADVFRLFSEKIRARVRTDPDDITRGLAIGNVVYHRHRRTAKVVIHSREDALGTLENI